MIFGSVSASLGIAPVQVRQHIERIRTFSAITSSPGNSFIPS
jgi:hypothetical protein